MTSDTREIQALTDEILDSFIPPYAEDVTLEVFDAALANRR